MDIEYIKNFEKDIAARYINGEIRGPIHLRDGNEKILIDIFQNIKKEDYVFSTWANHIHALLKGIPEEKILDRILNSESMAMNFPEYNFYTSAIVGGACPIAVGTAYAIKQKKKKNRVYIFIGDMTLYTGIANESIRYSINYDLPITWVIEDNGKSVSTPTESVWKENTTRFVIELNKKIKKNTEIIHYKYNSTYPHSGVGVFVSF